VRAAGAPSVASFEAAVLAEISLCNVCSCQEMLRRHGRGQETGSPGPEQMERVEWLNAGATLTTSERWACWAAGSPAGSAIANLREVAVSGSTTQIDPPDEGKIRSERGDAMRAAATRARTHARTRAPTAMRSNGPAPAPPPAD
jgi:hypothetical protein